MTDNKQNCGVTRRAALQMGILGAGMTMAPKVFGQTRVTVDEVPLLRDQAIFTLAGEHELVFFYGVVE